jgi:trk system potassium uptake protein TrkH
MIPVDAHGRLSGPPRLPKPRRLLTPIRLVVLSFALVILAGAALLSFPVSTSDHNAIPLVDALFTATTSVCVTGLVVHDTGTRFSLFGQVVILCLIQLGGLGYMTLATMLSAMLGRKVGVQRQLAVREFLGQFGMHEARPLLRRALVFTIIVEGIGAVFYVLILHRYLPWSKAAWYGAFHSVSAFCNAGLDLFGQRFGTFCSLVPFEHDPGLVLVTAIQIILGGLGFLVVSDLLAFRGVRRASLHTRVVLRCTLLLLAIGTAMVFVLERRPSGTVAGLPFDQQLLHSFFTSVTCRTAGFNTLTLGRLQDATLVFMCFLMFVGGSPGGTAGGIKTTTLVVVLSAIWATVRGNEHACLHERTLAHSLVYRALALFAMAVGVVFFCTTLLLVTEETHLESPSAFSSAAINVFFESTSAFGTVGLSTGITPTLTTVGKLIIILAMFLGRVGPISLAAALAARERPSHVQYPEGQLPIG